MTVASGRRADTAKGTYRRQTSGGHARPRPTATGQDMHDAGDGQRMRVTITGATGLIGNKLLAHLMADGAEVTVLSRDPARAAARLGVPAVGWDPLREPAPADALAGRDAVVHLAGENVAQRWSARARRAIRESRELGTRNLVDGLRDCIEPLGGARDGHSGGGGGGGGAAAGRGAGGGAAAGRGGRGAAAGGAAGAGGGGRLLRYFLIAATVVSSVSPTPAAINAPVSCCRLCPFH